MDNQITSQIPGLDYPTTTPATKTDNQVLGALRNHLAGLDETLDELLSRRGIRLRYAIGEKTRDRLGDVHSKIAALVRTRRDQTMEAIARSPSMEQII